MSGIGMWIVGVIGAVVAFVGLAFASANHGGPMYAMGMVMFAAGAAFDFWLIKRYFDQREGN